MGVLIIFCALFTFCLIAVFSIRIFYKRQFKFWKKYNVPHTKPRNVLGDIYKICLKKSPGEVIGDLYNKSKGKRYLGAWFWFQPKLVIRDPDLIKNVLVRDFVHFHDRVPIVDVVKDPLSGHLFSLRGSRWRNLRPKLTPAFTSGRMKNFFPVFVDLSKELIQLIDREKGSDEILDMREVCARFTTDIAVAYALGIRSECLKSPDSVFRSMGYKVFEPTLYNCFRSLVPVLISKAAKFIGLHPTPKDVSEFFLEVVKQVIESRENAERGSDYMQILVDLKKKGKIDITDRSDGTDRKTVNWDFTSNEAAAQAYIFFIAGFETSSLAIQYALYELSLNQAIQERVRTEVKEVVSKHDGNLTYDALNEMEYLSKVVHETLRKYPVVPLVFRTCTKDYPIPDSDAMCPKGVQVLVNVYGIHRDPEIYPDPENFDPERFSPEEKSKRHNYSYLPFGEGPRSCLGMRFSLLQKKVALATLLTNFRFEISSRTTVPLIFHPNSFFFAPKGGMPLKITKL